MFAFEGVFQKSDEIFSLITFNFAFVVTVIFFIINLETAVNFGEQILPFAEIFPYVILPIFVAIVLFWKNKNNLRKMKFENENTKNPQKPAKNAQILKNEKMKTLKVFDISQFQDLKMCKDFGNFGQIFKEKWQIFDLAQENLQKDEEIFDEAQKGDNSKNKMKMLKKAQKMPVFCKKDLNFKTCEAQTWNLF